MNEALKLFSLNIERGKHYDRWIPFVKRGDFDIVCLQEVYEPDLKMFEDELGMKFIFVPMCNVYHDNTHEEVLQGIAIGSRAQSLISESSYYFQKYDSSKKPDSPSGFKDCGRVLLCSSYKKNDQVFHICTTHFTHTPNGEITEQQKKDAHNLLNLLSDKEEFILCGDMNAPREKACFSMFEKEYTDNIPKHYTSSLDIELRSSPFIGDSNLMVDALFSTPHYAAENVELVSGLSDHKAIVADFYKKEE